jgi:hypothetical protein
MTKECCSAVTAKKPRVKAFSLCVLYVKGQSAISAGCSFYFLQMCKLINIGLTLLYKERSD